MELRHGYFCWNTKSQWSLWLLSPWLQHVPACCFMLYLPPKSINMVLIPWLIVGYIIFDCELLKSKYSNPSNQNEKVLNSSLNNFGSWHSKLKLVNLKCSLYIHVLLPPSPLLFFWKWNARVHIHLKIYQIRIQVLRFFFINLFYILVQSKSCIFCQ